MLTARSHVHWSGSLLLLLLGLLLSADRASAQRAAEVVVPKHGDKYAQFVRQLEAGQTAIDYTEFRHSFLESEQFKAGASLTELRAKLRERRKSAKPAEIIETAKEMLSLDYTDMEAHKTLQQRYKSLGDSANYQKYHDIEFGLLNSIVKKGNGRTCATAWPVIQVSEEYFILDMIGATVLQQGIDTKSGTCDRLEVRTAEGNKTYYFEITKVMEGYQRRGIK